MIPLEIGELVADPAINPRSGGLSAPHVEEIRDWLLAHPDQDMPRVIAYREGATHHLSEGFHRHEAYRLAGRTRIPCEVREGDRDAAQLNAAASNKGHGLKRTNDDKRLAVRLVLALKSEWTDRQVAEHCGVGADMVGDTRAAVAAEGDVSDSDTSTRGKGRRGGSAKKSKKENYAKAASALLLHDHTRADEHIAAEVGCRPRIVAIARKALEDKGRIPKPEKAPEPASPAVEFVSRINRLCAALDAAKKEAAEIAGTELYGQHVHAESVTQAIESARKALWQSRPTDPCNCVKGDRPAAPGCKACFGAGVTTASRVLGRRRA